MENPEQKSTMMKQTKSRGDRKTPLTGHATALLVGLALIASACSSGGSTNTSDQASVSVASIESGCAEAIDVMLLLNGAPRSEMTVNNMRLFADGAASLSASFPDAPSEVRDFFNVLQDVVGNAASTAEQDSGLSATQIQLLLDFELAGRQADFDRLVPSADEYFTAQCGAPYSNALAGVPATPAATPSDTAVVAGADDGATSTTAAPGSDTTEADAESKGEIPEETTTQAPAPAGAIAVDTSSMGATLRFLGVELVVGEIWRTDLTPESAVTGGSETGDQSAVLVEVRMTSTTHNLFSAPADYGFVSSEGFRTNADEALTATGERWNLDLDENESTSGFLVFEGGLGQLSGGQLQWIKDGEAANAPLGLGATVPAYPFELAGTNTANPAAHTDANSCRKPYEAEVRSSEADLDRFGQFQANRAPRNERFIRIEVAIEPGEITGEATVCSFTNTLRRDEIGLRLRLNNGDALAAVSNGLSSSIDVGETVVAPVVFQVAADTTFFELVDGAGTVIATWDDLALPAA